MKDFRMDSVWCIFFI